MENGPNTPARPRKRRKITPTPTKESYSSRILKSVEQAAHDKHQNRLGKNIVGTDIIPRKPTSSTSRTPKTIQSESNGLQAASAAAANDDRDDTTDELGDDEDGIMTATPTKSRSSGHRQPGGKVQVLTGTGTVGNTTRARPESPTRRMNKKYKGWEYLPEGEETGINNQDAFAKIAEEAALEAAKGSVEGEELATVSTKSLRTRKKRESPKLVNVKDKKAVHVEKTAQKRKQTEKRTVPSKKSKEAQVLQEEPRASDSSAQDVSDDELQQEDSSNEVAAVQLKTPREAQSWSMRTQREGSKDVLDHGGPWNTLKKSIFADRSVQRSAAQQSANSLPIPVSQDELSKTTSDEDFLIAACHLKTLLSDNSAILNNIKMQVILQLTANCRPPPLPPHLLGEHEILHQLLSQTVQAGEGNSMLIIGSRGSGKSCLVERSISDLTWSNGEDFHVVKLNGFVHTDDKLALREIWRQLGKELEGSDEDVGLRTNYADTLTSLLALLSHQDESQDENQEQTSTTRSIIFILDEFDLFTHHPRQTLLYNLFDVAQSHRNAPIAVLGLTTKINIIEQLEKRVKSRFSQRTLHVPLPKTLPIFKSACLNALSYHPSSPANSADCPPTPILNAWTTYITALLSTSSLTTLLQTHHHLSNSPASFLSQIALPLLYSLTLSTLSSPQIPDLSPPDSPLLLLPALTTLQISLLIAACRLDILLSTDICTFEMVYEEYIRLVARGKAAWSHSGGSSSSGVAGGGGRVWGRGVARGAWEGLGAVGLMSSAGGEGSRAEVGLEEIGAWIEGEEGRRCLGGAGTGLGKWCREL